MTKQITLPSGEYMLVEVPEGKGDFKIIHKGTRLAWFQPTYSRVDIPYGNYSILGVASQISEEVAAGIVGRIPKGNLWNTTLPTGQDSIHSLVRSHGYEPEHCLILKIG